MGNLENLSPRTSCCSFLKGRRMIGKKDNVKNMFSDIIGETEASKLDVKSKSIISNEMEEPPTQKKKKQVSEIVEDWLNSPDLEPKAKKKKKNEHENEEEVPHVETETEPEVELKIKKKKK